MTKPEPVGKKRLSASRKFALTLGALVSTTVSSSDAEGDVVFIDDRPVRAEISFDNYFAGLWDVDGDGTHEFRIDSTFSTGYRVLATATSTTYSGYTYFVSIRQDLAIKSRGLDGYGVVQQTESASNDVKNLGQGFSVGPTLSAYAWPGYRDYEYGRVLLNYFHSNRTRGGVPNTNYGPDSEFEIGDQNLIGFRFEIGNDVHYGWAQLEITKNSLTVSKWAYESTPDTAIRVGAGLPTIPEPSSLGLLALGAPGVTSLRRRRNQQRDTD